MSFFDKFFSKSQTAVLHISGANGFHLRPAAQFASEAKKFSCTIEAETRGQSVDAKNLNALLSLNLDKGEHFELVCKGKDAQEAITHLSNFFENLMQQEDPEISAPSKVTHHYRGDSIGGEIIAPGIAIAPLWHYHQECIQTSDTISFQDAIQQSIAQLDARIETYTQGVDSSIYVAQKALLVTLAKSCDTIETFEKAVTKQCETLRGGKMEAKIIDYKDVLQRVKQRMGEIQTVTYPSDPFILLASDLLPSQVETLPSHTAGVILQQTSLTSHTAILLRAAGIPSLIIQSDIPHITHDVILDSHNGTLVLHPEPTDIQEARVRQEQDKLTLAEATGKCFEPAVTSKGETVTVLANITDVASAKAAKEAGAEGVGLLRTEFLFKEKAPTLEAQRDAYRTIFALFDDVTVRTLDVGGDKALPYIELPQENNPFLGIRGIRLLKTHPELIETQLRAIFEAAEGKAVKVMFPMVSTVEEFTEAKTFAKEVAKTYDCDIANIRFGIMVEVPSVLFSMQAFNQVVDFYSIGTNDLNQYLFAIERTHPTLSLDPRSEVLLRAVAQVAKESNKPVSICGELAGDTKATAQLINMGIKALSVSPKRIATLKETIRHV